MNRPQRRLRGGTHYIFIVCSHLIDRITNRAVDRGSVWDRTGELLLDTTVGDLTVDFIGHTNVSAYKVVFLCITLVGGTTLYVGCGFTQYVLGSGSSLHMVTCRIANGYNYGQAFGKVVVVYY